MASFEIYGGKPLKGELYPQGAKNEALQVICAVLLTREKVVINNIPNIIDVVKLIELLADLGVKVQPLGPNRYSFQADDVNLEIRKDTLPPVVDSQNRERVYQVVPTAETVVHMTRGPKEVEHIDDRLDPVILSQLRENPYAVSIGGVAK